MPRSEVYDAPRVTSRGGAYFGAIFDVLGSVTLTVSTKGTVRGCITVEGIPPHVAQRFLLAYGGKLTRVGWRAERTTAVRFAEAVKYFAPDKKEHLELFSQAMRIVGAKKGYWNKDGEYRNRPLSQRDKQKRREIVQQLLQAQARLIIVSELPAAFLRSEEQE